MQLSTLAKNAFWFPASYCLRVHHQRCTRRTISASIGVGIPEDPGSFGMIFEFSGFCTGAEAALKVEEMVREAFEMRSLALREVKVRAIDHVVGECGTVFAGCPLFFPVKE